MSGNVKLLRPPGIRLQLSVKYRLCVMWQNKNCRMYSEMDVDSSGLPFLKKRISVIDREALIIDRETCL
jgi:hypothetical protein